MAQIALAFCLVCIFIALVLDIKKSRRVSKLLWIPTIWLGLGASKSISLWLYPKLMSNSKVEIDYLAGSPLERNFAIFMILLGLAALYKRRERFSIEFKSNIWIYIFYIYALMSVSWSNYSGVSIKRWIKLAADAIMVLIILTEDERGEAIEHVFRRCSIVLIPLSVLFIRYYRWIGVYYDHTGAVVSWRGVSDHKNGLGLLCAYFGVFLIWRILKGWPKINIIDLFLLLLAVYLLLGSRSSTSAVVFVIGVIILSSEFFRKRQGNKFNNVTIVALLIISILQGLLLIIGETSIVPLFFSAAGRDQTFTGRVSLWQDMIKIGKQRPILGAGYGGFWIGNLTHNLWEKYSFRINNSHNGYIDVFIDLGLIGVIFLFFLIVKAFHDIAVSYKGEKAIGTLLFTFFIMILFHNITESTLARATSFLWGLFLLSIIIVTNKQKRPTRLL